MLLALLHYENNNHKPYRQHFMSAVPYSVDIVDI